MSRLVLTRTVGESVVVGSGPDRVVINVVTADRGRAKLSVEAPRSVSVLRGELSRRPDSQPAPDTVVGELLARARALAAEWRALGRSRDELLVEFLDGPVPHPALAPCLKCSGSGYEVHPRNGAERFSRRCPNGCAVRCSVCQNPECDNPGGQH